MQVLYRRRLLISLGFRNAGNWWRNVHGLQVELLKQFYHENDSCFVLKFSELCYIKTFCLSVLGVEGGSVLGFKFDVNIWKSPDLSV